MSRQASDTNGFGPSATPGQPAATGSPWAFVRLDQYRMPGVPARSALAGAWASIENLLRSPDRKGQAPVRNEAELRTLPEVRLQHLVPPIDWAAANGALDAAIADTPQGPVQFVIGQPHCGHEQIVRLWGARNDAVPIAAPSVEQILAGNRDWLDAWPAADRCWALPELEHCYLRHPQGLSLVRELLARIAGGRAGRGLVGCDSWAWAYLQHVWPLSRPDALTLQAFDGERLMHVFAQLASAQGSGTQRLFRNARTGSDMLSVPSKSKEVSAELVQLAAHCRGNVGTARSYWRRRLRLVSAEMSGDAGLPAATAESDVSETEIVWVSEALQEPALPLEADEDAALVLHALLLHNGLGESLLPLLLPLDRHRCLAILTRLRNLGVVRLQDDRWRVDPLGYALVRDLLRSRDYLIDDF